MRTFRRKLVSKNILENIHTHCIKMRVLPSILVLYCFCNRVLADQIFATQIAGATFGRSSREPKYKIEFHPEDSPFHPDDNQESTVMRGKNGQRYLCYLPKVEKVKSGRSFSQLNTSSLIVESEEQVKLKTPDELLEALRDQCFVRQEAWWSYEFCYQKKLRQIHVEDNKEVQQFVLGEYDEDATSAYNQNLSDISTLKDPRSKDASQRYHAHQYTNGTVCDLTNTPRETEVRFVCAESTAMISSITELSTCKYALTVQCPTLCKHPLFQEETPVWHTIDCNALPKTSKETKTETDKSEEMQVIMATNVESSPGYESE